MGVGDFLGKYNPDEIKAKQEKQAELPDNVLNFDVTKSNNTSELAGLVEPGNLKVTDLPLHKETVLAQKQLQAVVDQIVSEITQESESENHFSEQGNNNVINLFR